MYVFFKGMEKAITIALPLRLELEIKRSTWGSATIETLVRNKSLFIAAMQTGMTLSMAMAFISSCLYVLNGNFFLPGNETTGILITVISVFVILFISGELLSAALFTNFPYFFLRYLSLPAFLAFCILYPVVRITLAASGFIIRTVTDKKNFREDIAKAYPEEKGFRIQSGQQRYEERSDDSNNISLLNNIIGFSSVRVREIMVPRTEIEAVDVSDPVALLRKRFIETRYSRILVYDDSIDNISGYVELKDIFSNPEAIAPSVKKLAVVPETMTASSLLRLFITEKKNIALVVDEFGGTAGMITIEDLLEEIVGDIEDEHDTNELTEKTTASGEYVLSGRLEIDYLNKKYELGLPVGDDYETLAGMIIFHHGRIPLTGEVVKIDALNIRVLKSTSTRIELVKISYEKAGQQ